MITREHYGTTKSGSDIVQYRIRNTSGMEATLISYGACLTGLNAPDRDGVYEDVVLGYRTLEEYEANPGCLGASIGRSANRIGGARFALNGVEYGLDRNNGCNSLHGGIHGWHLRAWESAVAGDNAVVFIMKSPHMDQGFPGEMTLRVIYTLSEENALSIRYEAVSDRDTLLNPTNHSYFNLTGKQGGKTVLGEYVRLNASTYTPADSASIPDGRILPVDGTPMDFRDLKLLGRDITADFDQLIWGNGYDHNWLLDGQGMRPGAVLFDCDTGRRMTMFTDLPAVQMYTGNFLTGKAVDKLGQPIPARSGVCFETQFPPDAINKPAFPSPILPAGVPFRSETVYAFDVVPTCDLISVGEALVDFLPGTEPGSFLAKPGGAPANCAVSAARQGISTAFCGRVGDDAFGRMLLDTLWKNGIRPLCTEPVREACTTMAFVSLDANGDRSFTFARKPGADMFLTSGDLSDEALLGTVLVHAGSCSLSRGSAAEATREILRRAHQMGKRVSFDMNYRDVMWEGDAESAVLAVRGILPFVDFLKVSDSEALMLGGEAELERLRRTHGITLVVETLGGEGAKCFWDGGVLTVPAVSVNCVDATGAGDAFWGGFLAELLKCGFVYQEDTISEAMRRGAVSGALCVQRKGAMDSLPTAAEVDAARVHGLA